MQESEVRAGPDLQVSSMVPRPIDVISSLDPLHFSETLEKVRWVSTVVVVAAVLAALSFSLFIFTR
jgi:hypothetical protein